MRVLVVDGDRVDREVAMRALEDRGHAAEGVGDADEALGAIERSPPDVVVTDLLLARRDALALMLHVRARPALQRIPFVILSQEPASSLGPLARALGARAYIEKPWSREDLVHAVEEAEGPSPLAPTLAAPAAEGLSDEDHGSDAGDAAWEGPP